jgi:anti-sigma regulatory factor (Ser/Thr protein kinase)
MPSEMVIRLPRFPPPDSLRKRLPSTPASVPEARRFTLESLAPRIGDEDALYDAQLVACELASNGIKHGVAGTNGWIEVSAGIEDNVVCVSVSDPGPGFEPADRYEPPPGVSASGWGLVIVSRVASRWGAWPGRPFTVWAEIDLSPEERTR